MSSIKGPQIYRDKSFKFPDFKAHAPGEYVEVKTQEELDEKMRQVLGEIGFCRLYTDNKNRIKWISGIGPKMGPRYIYYLKLK